MTLTKANVIDGEVVEPTELTETQKFVKGLRDMAAFIEAHPELPMPCSTLRVDYWPKLEELRDYVRTFGRLKKDAIGDSYFVLRKEFYKGAYTSISIEANWSRDSVCKKVKTGTKKVMQTVQTKPPETIEVETEVETFKWECPKVAAPPAELVEGDGE
jgi:hypothetical protein